MLPTLDIVYDDKEVNDALSELLRRTGPGGFRPALREIGEDMEESTKRRFNTSTSPDGYRWAPNARRTYDALIAKTSGATKKDGKLSTKGQTVAINKKPLVETGKLRDSINYQLLPGGDGVAIGTNRFAGDWEGGAAVHQFGNQKGTIPARPFLGISAADKNNILDVIGRHLVIK